MCGIIGGAGRIYKPGEDMVMQLLMLDTQRGPHSTGLMSVDKIHGQAQTVKCVGTPWDLVEVPAFDKLWKRSHKVLLGHNRWATRGKITARNAHPFTHGHITGVHNGTLRDQKLLTNHKNFEVDSDNIFHDINANGAEETIKTLDGAYCLVWFNGKEQTINFIRNHERTMYIAKSKDGFSMYWASEQWMLNVAAMKSRVDIEPPYLLPINLLTSFKVTGQDVIPAEDSGKVVEGYERPLAHGNYWTGGTTGNGKPKEVVEFEVIGEKNSSYSRSYMRTDGEVISGEHKGKSIRVFAANYPILRRQLITSTKFFKGEVTFAFRERVDLTDKWIDVIQVNPSSITEFDPNVKALDTPAKINYRQILFKDFKKCTTLGCYWCGHKPNWEERDTLHWNKKFTEFLCEDCNIAEYQQYFDDAEGRGLAGGNS